MCGIAGCLDWRKNMLEQALLIEQMNDSLAARGPDGSGVWLSPRCAFGHRRLSVIDPENGAQPMVFQGGEQRYVLTYNGELYNANALRQQLQHLGHRFKTICDTEVLLHACIEWGIGALQKLNGIFAFAFWDEQQQSCLIARDRLGVKPLFFAPLDDGLLFASEMKALLLHPDIKPEVDATGMAEIWGLGPARTPGHAIFKQIRELRPGHWLSFSRDGLREGCYWQLQASEHTDSLALTVEKVTQKLEQATERQLVSDVPLCMFLSGGLDSSALSALANTSVKMHEKRPLQTFSVDYEDQSTFFRAHAFQPNSDDAFIDVMSSFLGSHHQRVELQIEQLFETLDEVVTARDTPGMADIDASLLLFCREIKKIATVAISGEAADEIFGGYPWFQRSGDLTQNVFPWAPAIEIREKWLSKEALQLIQPRHYVARRVAEANAEAQSACIGSVNSPDEQRLQELTYLNITRFMPVLLDRKDRMSMACGLEVRVPFCDHELVEYAFNIPWHIKQIHGREKGLLRTALKNALPDQVLWRKKSPYPKTHHPAYSTAVKRAIGALLADTNAPLRDWIDVKTLQTFIASEDADSNAPWFGQLMSGPQSLAYLLQINMWLRKYKVRFV